MATVRTASALLAVEEPSPLFPEPAEIVVGVIAFVLLFLFLKAKVFPIFEKTYANRTEAIEGGIARAEQAQREAEAALADYRGQLAGARQEAAGIRDEARAQAESIRTELREQAEAESARILAAAEAQLRVERQQTLTSLRQEVGGLAVQLASRIVGESLEDEARRRNTVDRFLADLERTSAPDSRSQSGSSQIGGKVQPDGARPDGAQPDEPPSGTAQSSDVGAVRR